MYVFLSSTNDSSPVPPSSLHLVKRCNIVPILLCTPLNQVALGNILFLRFARRDVASIISYAMIEQQPVFPTGRAGPQLGQMGRLVLETAQARPTI
jgi:hypothetical protein